MASCRATTLTRILPRNAGCASIFSSVRPNLFFSPATWKTCQQTQPPSPKALGGRLGAGRSGAIFVTHGRPHLREMRQRLCALRSIRPESETASAAPFGTDDRRDRVGADQPYRNRSFSGSFLCLWLWRHRQLDRGLASLAGRTPSR